MTHPIQLETSLPRSIVMYFNDMTKEATCHDSSKQTPAPAIIIVRNRSDQARSSGYDLRALELFRSR